MEAITFQGDVSPGWTFWQILLLVVIIILIIAGILIVMGVIMAPTKASTSAKIHKRGCPAGTELDNAAKVCYMCPKGTMRDPNVIITAPNVCKGQCKDIFNTVGNPNIPQSLNNTCYVCEPATTRTMMPLDSVLACTGNCKTIWQNQTAEQVPGTNTCRGCTMGGTRITTQPITSPTACSNGPAPVLGVSTSAARNLGKDIYPATIPFAPITPVPPPTRGKAG